MVIIPCRPDLTHYDMQVVLDGVTYGFEFRWNTREGAWYMHVFAEDGAPILYSVKVVVAFPLGARVTDPNMFPGRLIAYDTTNLDLNPGIADLGDRVMLVYLSADDVEVINA